MSGGSEALAGIFVVVAAGAGLGFYAGTRTKMDLEQWAVAGRGFGSILVWLLMAGEVYTAFSFLGASGWAYSRGGPSLYILAYLSLGYVVSFYFLPELWEVGRTYKLQSQSDFFEKRYRSKTLAAFVSIVGVVFLIPYVQLQLTGLGIIVEVASFETISRTAAMIIAAAVVAGFVFAGGIRAVAWVSILKDILLLAAVLAIGIAVPYRYFHGIAPMFRALQAAHPRHLMMPGSTKDLGHGWYISTVLLNSLGVYMWPHFFGASFSAKSGEVLRRNAVIMPLYTITLPFIFFVGFAALMVIPGLADGDMSLLTMVRQTFPPWALGIIGGAGALTAMVPAAILILTAATLFAKNFCRPLFVPGMTDDQTARFARIVVGIVAAIALFFAVYTPHALVNLLLWGYDGVSQFFPGVILGLFWARVTRPAVWSGMISGVTIVGILVLTKHDPFLGLNAGFLALCVNFAVVGLVSVLTRPELSGFEEALQAGVQA